LARRLGRTYLVAKETDEECADSNDEDTSKAGYVVVNRMNKLGADNAIDRRPAYTREYVENGDEFDSVPTKPETGKNHLTKTEAGTHGGEVADGNYTNQVEEEDDEDGISETEEEDGFSEHSNCEGTDDHVCGEPLE
jgi:hypothetical protein